MTPTHRLENTQYALDFDRESGRLLQLRDKIGGFDLIQEPRLAENFRLLLPLPHMRGNYILGTEQTLTSAEKSANGIALHWAGPLRNERGEFNLGVTLWIELVGVDVQFRCEVRNGTPHQLGEVWYAMLGGMRGFGDGEDARDAEVLLPHATRFWQQPIFRDFGNTRGQTLGTLSGEHSFSYPGFMCMPWMSLFHPKRKRALYSAALEETPRVKAIRFALDPGLAEKRADGNWPRPDEVGDLPLGLTMNWVHFPFTKPGDTFTSAPVVFRCHDGGWRESAAIYRKWFTAKYPVIKPGSTWIRRETAFLHTMFMLPEDNINLRFTEIPSWANNAHDRGINHLMIAGWQVGGHDRGYPYYTPDPRLGTWDELQAGIRAAHDLGMRVSFFVNCQPIDMTTEWYKQELHKYRVLDPYGVQYFITNYWGMGTLSARSRLITATPNSEMNPAHPAVRALLIRQFRRLVEIGADGLHLDKFFHTPFDFNPLLKDTSPDRAHHEGILKFLDELFAACRAINPEFCISYEGGWDRNFAYADTLWWGPADSTLKAVFPQMAFCAGVEQPYDYNKVNEAVLHADHLLIGPANYNRGTDYPPMQKLFEYIAEVTRIRRELLHVVSLGEKLDASDGLFQRSEPLVTFTGAKDVRWTLFRDETTGRQAVVLANLSGRPLEVTGLRIEAAGRACRVYQPFQAARDDRFPLSLSLAPEQVCFVVEA
jgi:hypothetical protein